MNANRGVLSSAALFFFVLAQSTIGFNSRSQRSIRKTHTKKDVVLHLRTSRDPQRAWPINDIAINDIGDTDQDAQSDGQRHGPARRMSSSSPSALGMSSQRTNLSKAIEAAADARLSAVYRGIRSRSDSRRKVGLEHDEMNGLR